MKVALTTIVRIRLGPAMLLSMLFSSLSCMIKTGNYFFNDKDFRRFGTDCFDVWEFETSSPRFWGDKFDVSGSLGILNLDWSRSYYHRHHDQYHHFYYSSTDLIDLNLTARFYPFEILGIQPYIGVGGSWFWLGATDDRHASFHYYDGPSYYYDYDSDHNTFADGFYYHTVSGILIPLHELPPVGNIPPGVFMVLEHRFDFAKKSDGYDLSGNKVLMGVGIRF